MSDLCGIVSEGISDEFVLECVGVLGNLSLPDLDYSQILTKFNLLNWIMNQLQPDAVADDLALEVVILLGTVAADESAARLLADSGVLGALVNLLNGKYSLKLIRF